ncbi:hypothetical protein [Pseudomonas sp. Irchel 3E20]|uniref:hypothetical protein n=1 Tax=Pseudomonas sp. Irchel 3E20 TaxID=2008983 RepID=UPI000BA4519C|nr:hypothetical protein [Pseudomonas sp. Irchel 3E20]
MTQALTLDAVRDALKEQLAGTVDNVDGVYITGSVINDQGIAVASYSESLPWAFLKAMQDNEVPQFGGDHMNIYSVAYSLDTAHLYSGVSFAQINAAGQAVAPLFLG